MNASDCYKVRVVSPFPVFILLSNQQLSETRQSSDWPVFRLQTHVSLSCWMLTVLSDHITSIS